MSSYSGQSVEISDMIPYLNEFLAPAVASIREHIDDFLKNAKVFVQSELIPGNIYFRESETGPIFHFGICVSPNGDLVDVCADRVDDDGFERCIKRVTFSEFGGGLPIYQVECLIQDDWRDPKTKEKQRTMKKHDRDIINKVMCPGRPCIGGRYTPRDPEETIKLALEHVDSCKSYHVKFFNCGMFAFYCKYAEYKEFEHVSSGIGQIPAREHKELGPGAPLITVLCQPDFTRMLPTSR